MLLLIKNEFINFFKKLFNVLINLNVFFKIFLLISILLYISGLFFRNEILLNYSIICAFFTNVIYGFFKIKKYWLFLIFHSSLFLFILGKPFLYSIRFLEVPRKLHYPTNFESINFGVLLVLISLISILIGAIFFETSQKEDFGSCNSFEMKINKSILQNILIVIIGVSYIFVMIQVIEKILFIQTHVYTEYYTLFRSQIPTLLKMPAQLFLPSVIMYLATFPSKNKSIIVLILYTSSYIGDFVVGMRSKIMLPLVFGFIYFVIREYYLEKQNKNWITKKSLIIILISLPFIASGLFFYNYIRQDVDLNSIEKRNPVVSFIDQQGETYLVICSSGNFIDNVREPGFPGYVLGPIYDSLKYNRVSRFLFKTPELVGQNEQTLQYSKNFNFQLSHTMMGDLYYQGRGVGSSYLLDIYYDFSYIGLIVFSFLLGIFMLAVPKIMSKNYFFSFNILMILSTLIYMVRDNSMSAVVNCFDIYNILTYISVFVLYFLIIRVKEKYFS